MSVQTARRPARLVRQSTRPHDHRELTALPIPGSRASEESDRAVARLVGPEPCPGSASRSRSRPLPRLNDENSYAKFQNVREDSSADFDARMTPDEFGGADGMSFMLLNVARFGSSGPAPFLTFYEEPNLAGSFGLGMDIYPNAENGDPNDNHLSLHFGGTKIADFPDLSLDLSSGKFIHVSLTIEFTSEGGFVTVKLTPDSLTEIPGFDDAPH